MARALWLILTGGVGAIAWVQRLRAPLRLWHTALPARMTGGALSGGVMAARHSARPLPLAVIGAATTVAVAYGAAWLRPRLPPRLRLPEAAMGLAEDVVVISTVSLFSRRAFGRKSG